MAEPRGVYVECEECLEVYRLELAAASRLATANDAGPPVHLPACPRCGGRIDEFLCVDPDVSGVFPNLWLSLGRARDGTSRLREV